MMCASCAKCVKCDVCEVRSVKCEVRRRRGWCRAPLAGRSMIGEQLIEESDIVPCIVHIVAVHIVPRYGPCRDSGAPCCGNRKLRLTAVPHRGQSTELGRTSLLSHRTVSTVSLLLSVSGDLRRWVGGAAELQNGAFLHETRLN